MPFLKPYLCIVLAASPPARYTKYLLWGRLRRPQTPTLGSDTYPCQPWVGVRGRLRRPAPSPGMF